MPGCGVLAFPLRSFPLRSSRPAFGGVVRPRLTRWFFLFSGLFWRFSTAVNTDGQTGHAAEPFQLVAGHVRRQPTAVGEHAHEQANHHQQ